MSKKKIAVYLSLFALLFNSFLQPGVVLAEELTTSTEEPAGSNTSGTLEESTIPSADSSSLESSATTSSKIDTEDPVSYEGEVTNPRITYNANGGSNSGVVKNDQIALNGAYTVGTVGTGADQLNFTAPSPSKQIFDGWNTDPNGGGDSYSSGEVVDSWPYSTDTILYAQWATASTVSYNLNGATSQSTPASQFGKSGTTVTVPSIPTDLVMKENTSAAGTWTTNADGTGTEYSPGSSYTLTDSNTILYLKIVANPFDADATLTFNLDGGTTTDTDLTNGIKTNVSNDYKVSLPSATPTKTNYTFAGWSINNKTYAASSEVTLTYSTVAKALWTPIQYVLYENGLPSGSSDTVAGMPSNTQVPANGAKYTVPNNVPTRTSNDGSGTIYKFEYWRLDNTQNIAPGGQWSTNKQVATWHFVAIWSSFNPTSQWTVSLNSNSATGGAKPYEYTYVDKGKALIIPGRGSMVKSGFTFVGWSDGTTVYSAGDSYTPTGNITLTAEWMENSTQGTIKFITQSKSGSNPSAQTGTAGDQIKLPDIPVDNTPPQEGYVFWGWAKDKNATVPDYYAGKSYTLSTGITTLYGVWTGSLSEYWTQIKVNVDGADGSLPEGIKSNNFYELTSATDTHLFTVPTITKTGYTLTGWYYSKDAKTYQPGDTISLANIAETKNPGTLTAKWDPITYKITYDKGDATGGAVPTTDTITVNYNKSYTVLKNTNSLVKDGYTFIGWTDGTNIYTPGQNLSPTKDIVLKPAWKKNPSGGGGGGTIGNVNIMYVALESGVTGDLPDSVNVVGNYTTSYTVANPKSNFSYPGYTFSGWYLLDSTGQKIFYSPGSSFVVGNTNLIFYAAWTKEVPVPENSYKVEFNGNKNTSGLVPDSQYVLKGSSTKLPSSNTLVRDEFKDNNASTGTIETNPYIFVGWSKNKDAKANDSDVLLAGTSITPTSDEVYYAIWDLKVKDITLTYDGNGNTGGTPPASVTEKRYTEGKIDSSNQGSTLTKSVVVSGELTTYVFAGWNTKADGTGTDYYSGSLFNFPQDTTLYAKWVPIKSTSLARIIYLGNGQTSGDFIRYDDTSASSYTIKGAGNMAKSEHIFTGWNTKADGTGTSYNSGESITTSDHTSLVLYAQWEKAASGINVIYNGNGNTSGSLPDSFNGPKGSNVTLASSADVTALGLKKTGYMFAGWSKNIAGTGTQYVAGQSYTFNENTILYAIWAEDGNYIATPSEVTYHPNYNGVSDTYNVKGSVDSTATVDGTNILHGHKVVAQEINGGVYLGEDYTVASYSTTGLPNRTNYAFAGWSTDPKATKAMYSSEQVINMNTTSLDLYAVWVPGTYQIIFDKNAADATETMNNQTVTYDKDTNLNMNQYKRPGYSFTGWTTKSDGSGDTYEDKVSIKNLAEVDESITLYAQWSGNKENSILFDLNADNDPNATTDQKDILNLATGSNYDLSTDIKDASRTGYKFTGWYTEATGSTKMPASLVIPNGNTTYYAHWEAINYEVAFDKNASDAIGSMSNQAFAYDEQKELSENTFTRPGYTFTGWNTEAKGSGTTYADKAQVKNLLAKDGSTITLYAQWSGNESNNILFDLNANNDPNATTDQKNILNLATGSSYDLSTGIKDASRTGYKFTGWYTDATGSTKMPASLVIPNGNTTYYAHWEAINYEVAFDKNASDAIGSMSNQAFAYDEQKELSENTFTRPGYTFTGWNTEAKGSGTTYADKAQVKNLLAKDGSTITLYAQWSGNESNNILFDLNANNDPNATTDQKNILNLATGSSYDLSTGIKDASRTGYKFTGWYTEATGSTKMPASLVIPNGNTTYYAHWEAINYEVAFDKNASDAIGSMSNQAFAYDEQKELSENTFTRPGYTFTGWNTEAKGSGTTYADKAQVKN
ncbi:InlB B-repeat-containing protein, partial [Enterococcus sp. ALS3]